MKTRFRPAHAVVAGLLEAAAVIVPGRSGAQPDPGERAEHEGHHLCYTAPSVEAAGAADRVAAHARVDNAKRVRFW
jgi:hypothetical protein